MLDQTVSALLVWLHLSSDAVPLGNVDYGLPGHHMGDLGNVVLRFGMRSTSSAVGPEHQRRPLYRQFRHTGRRERRGKHCAGFDNLDIACFGGLAFAHEQTAEAHVGLYLCHGREVSIPFTKFSLGVIHNLHIYSASIVSIIREVYAGRFGSNADSSWSDVPIELVSVSELMVGFLASSIPTYRPLWRHLFFHGNENDGLKGSGPSARNLAPNTGGQWPSNEQTHIKISAGDFMPMAMTMNEFGETDMSEDVGIPTQTMRGWRRDDWMSVRHYGSDDNLREIV